MLDDVRRKAYESKSEQQSEGKAPLIEAIRKTYRCRDT